MTFWWLFYRFFFCFTQCEFSFFSRDAVNDRVYFYSKCPLKSWTILLRVDGICFRLCGKSLSFSDFKNCVANPGVSWRRQTWQIQTQDAVYYDYTSWDFLNNISAIPTCNKFYSLATKCVGLYNQLKSAIKKLIFCLWFFWQPQTIYLV